MGTYLKWKQADGASYTNTYIYRADSESGTYTQIATQAYDDLNYYDIDGATSSWYKIRFYDSVLGKWSDFSNAIQGGTYTGYCTTKDVRDMTNLSVSDITDANLCILISHACAMLNKDVSVYIEDESVDYIDDVKTNDIDSENTVFYTYHYPVGDYNYDYKVNTSDIEVYEYDDTTDPVTKTKLTLSSIVPNTGKVTLSAAPGTDKYLTMTYRWSAVSMSDPDNLIKLAAIYLAASLAYQKINIGKSPSFRLGNVSVRRDMDSFKYYRKLYNDVVTQILDRFTVYTATSPSIPELGSYELNVTAEPRNRPS